MLHFVIEFGPRYERPRELLLERGSDSVFDAGLIAILLRSGTKGRDAVTLARDLINRFGSLRGILNARKQDLESIRGLGPAKIAQLMATIEITKRQLKEDIIGKSYIKNFNDVIEFISVTMRDLKEEYFKIICLNKAHVVLAVENIAKGTIDQTSIYPRGIIKKAINVGASALIFIHNHPAGSLTPSQFDIEITDSLINACKAVDISALDHIIISPEGYISLKNKGYIK